MNVVWFWKLLNAMVLTLHMNMLFFLFFLCTYRRLLVHWHYFLEILVILR